MKACSVSSTQREEAFLRPVVFPRRSLLAAGLTGAGIIGTLAYLWPPIAYPEQFRPEGNAVRTIDIPSLTATTTHNVANASQLSSAINTINTTSSAGHHIVLANGSYSGNYTIYAQGTEANPVVIRSSSLLGATLTGTLRVEGSWVIVYGLNGEAFIFEACDNCRLSRCAARISGSITMEIGTTYSCFDRNIVAGGNGRLCHHSTGSGDRVSFRNCIVYNHFKDSSGTDSSNPIPVQAGSGTYERMSIDNQCLIFRNRVENCGYSIAMQAKASGITFLQNTIVDCGRWAITLRHGRRCYVGGNWVPYNAGIGLRGDDHQIIGNVTQATSNPITANMGNIPDGSEGEPTTDLRPGWTFARRAKFIGNTGSLRLREGTETRPYPSVDSLIEAHTGSITIEPGVTGTIDRRNAPPSVEVPPAFELTAAQVGPYS